MANDSAVPYMLLAFTCAPLASSMSTMDGSPRLAAHISAVKPSQLRPFGSAFRASTDLTAAGFLFVMARNRSAVSISAFVAGLRAWNWGGGFVGGANARASASNRECIAARILL